MSLARYILLVLLFCCSLEGQATVIPAAYGLDSFPDARALKTSGLRTADSFIAHHPMMVSTDIQSDIEFPHTSVTRTSDFYLLLCLCLLLGLIRFMDPRYFQNLWRAFWNPTLSNRQLKDQLLGSGLSNFLMNFFFAVSGGAYVYYIVRFFTPHATNVVPPSLLILMLVAGTAFIYITKYAVIRFSGWAFRVEGITEHYLFNIFLINKVLGVLLVPFIIILAFADAGWAGQAVVVSFIIGGILLLNRYLRSWQVFGSFFQYSKFHFFMYLCASELLPMAVLIKLLVKWLLFY